MKFDQYLAAIRRSLWLFIGCIFLVLTLIGVWTLRSPKIYSTSVLIFVSTSGDTQTTSSLYNGGLAAEQRVLSYAQLVSSDRIAETVVRQLRLGTSPAELRSKISASAVKDSVLLRATVVDRDPEKAQLIANAVGAVFIQEVEKVEAPLAEGLPSPVRLTIWEEAPLPTSPVSPDPVRNILIGLVAGVAVGTLLSVARYRRDTSVKNASDVSESVSLPTLVSISVDSERPLNVLDAAKRPQSPRSETFRRLRTNLQFFDVDSPPRVIAVTSAVPGEGKSSTAISLAIAIGQSGASVALIEGDLRRPSFGQYIGVEPAAGLTTVLIGEATVAEVAQPVCDGQVLVIPSGPLPPNPSELLGSRAMSELLAELRGDFDYVVVDVPPLLAVTDGALISALSDGVIVVVMSGRTKREEMIRAADTLKSVEANILGVALNMVPAKKAASYGYSTKDGLKRRDVGDLDRLDLVPAIVARHRRIGEPAGNLGVDPQVGERFEDTTKLIRRGSVGSKTEYGK